MKTFHILNGDSLAEKFPKDLPGETIIWREALIEGPLPENDFFLAREKYLSEFVANPDYQNKVISEFQKFKNIPDDSEVYFWFEDDWFCQVNFWFLISELRDKSISRFRVFPLNQKDGFAYSDREELLSLYQSAQPINKQESELISLLWTDFRSNQLSDQNHTSEIVRNLAELITANEDCLNGKLNLYLKKISAVHNNFEDLFRQFQADFPIYGFGDLQLKKLLKKI